MLNIRSIPKALIVYTSPHHGNTEKVAFQIAKYLTSEVIQPSQSPYHEFKKYELFGFGSGIYFGKHHKHIFQFIESMPVLTGKKAFIFSTAGLKKPENHTRLRSALESKGFTIIGEFMTQGWDTFGPWLFIGGLNRHRPNEADLKEAAKFAENILRDSGLRSR